MRSGVCVSLVLEEAELRSMTILCVLWEYVNERTHESVCDSVL